MLITSRLSKLLGCGLVSTVLLILPTGCGEDETATEPDTVPPGKVSSLMASGGSHGPTGHSLLLTWTAPGDDGNDGRASEYDIRYSTAWINDANWDSLSRVSGIPEPSPCGEVDSCRVRRLVKDTTYCFALKTVDNTGNWSRLSNVLETTLADAHWWHGFGTRSRPRKGMNSSVLALTVYKEQLIAGGTFDWAGGANFNRIAGWDGSTWHPLGGGLDGQVVALEVFDGDLIVGGYFDQAGSAAANRIARWDGTHWEALGGGLTGGTWNNPGVADMVVYNGDLIVGGNFTWAGGTTTNHIARWDGSTWHALGEGIERTEHGVTSLVVFEGDLMVSGVFGEVGGVQAKNIARWDGDGWGPLGEGLPGEAYAMFVYNGRLIAGGRSWDGTSWQEFGPWGSAITVYNGDLIVGGGFCCYGEPENRMRSIARWDGELWKPLGSGVDVDSHTLGIYALAVYDGSLYVGGCFRKAGRKQSSYMARWDD